MNSLGKQRTSVVDRPVPAGARLTGIVMMLLWCAGLAWSQPSILVDTGAGGTSTIGSAGLIAAGSTNCSPQPSCGQAFNFLAGRITLTKAATLDHVDLWLGGGFGGQVTVAVRPVNPAKNGLPGQSTQPYVGTAIYQQTYSVPSAGTAGWHSFTGYTPVLAAGTYWICFEPVAGSQFNRTANKGVAQPLQRYAYFTNGNPGYFDLPASQAFGMRIWGTEYPGLAFGAATRSIMSGNPRGPFDTISGGEGETRNYHWIIDLAGYGGTFAIGKLTSGAENNTIENLNGLSAGANAVTCWSLYYYPCATAGARGVAYRTFKNTASSPKTLRVNTVLHGAYYQGGRAAAFVYVLDPDGFTTRIANSGVGSEQYLLRRDGLFELSHADETLSLAGLFPGSMMAIGSTFPTYQNGSFQSIPFRTTQFTVNAGEHFVLLFDVTAYSANGGSANFGDTLAPDTNLITDNLGNPVPEIIAVGPSGPVSPAAASISLTPLSSTTPIGEVYTATATVLDANGNPVPEKAVHFHVIAGPGVGEPGTVLTDALGQATFSYSSPVTGTDQINATVGTLTSNTISSTWTSPGLLDHIAISPATASIAPGGSQAYAASGYDKFDNLIGDVTTGTNFTITPDGSCTLEICTASTPGPHTVTGTNGTHTAQATLTVNSAPTDTVGPVSSNLALSPASVGVNVTASLTATISDAATGNSNVVSATYTVDGGAPVAMQLAPPSAVTTQASAAIPAFSQAGLHEICVSGRDAASNNGAATCTTLAVTDPEVGFVTGGGEVTIPAGSDLANPTVSGVASFGFNSKYNKNKPAPSGNVDFTLQQGNFSFAASGAEWLVVANGRATFQGTGVLNGSTQCKYQLDAWDRSFNNADALGIKIFDCGGQPGDRFVLLPRAIQGSIVIHN